MGSNQETPGVRVTVSGLRKSYDGHPVLKGLDFDVAPGEIFVVMGPSGSGKSVLLKHIIGLELPDEGEIFVNGDPVIGTQITDKYRMAMVFQSGGLLNSLTVGENVGLYLSEHQLESAEAIERIVAEKLKLVGLANLQHHVPSELSGGMKKRVALARALAVEPQLILYDEPTAELDPLNAITIGEEIYNLNQRIHVTSIVVTHDRDLAFGVADRVAIMVEGEILVVGTPEEIRSTSNTAVREFITADFNLNKTSKTP